MASSEWLQPVGSGRSPDKEEAQTWQTRSATSLFFQEQATVLPVFELALRSGGTALFSFEHPSSPIPTRRIVPYRGCENVMCSYFFAFNSRQGSAHFGFGPTQKPEILKKISS